VSGEVEITLVLLDVGSGRESRWSEDGVVWTFGWSVGGAYSPSSLLLPVTRSRDDVSSPELGFFHTLALYTIIRHFPIAELSEELCRITASQQRVISNNNFSG
jgi:hypothetical protein